MRIPLTDGEHAAIVANERILTVLGHLRGQKIEGVLQVENHFIIRLRGHQFIFLGVEGSLEEGFWLGAEFYNEDVDLFLALFQVLSLHTLSQIRHNIKILVESGILYVGEETSAYRQAAEADWLRVCRKGAGR